MAFRMVWRSLPILGSAGLMVCFSGLTIAQPLPQQFQAILQEKSSRTPAQRKLDSHVHLSAQVARGSLTSSTIPALANVTRLLELDGAGNVHVDMKATWAPRC